jgi:hypothetical protein
LWLAERVTRLYPGSAKSNGEDFSAAGKNRVDGDELMARLKPRAASNEEVRQHHTRKRAGGLNKSYEEKNNALEA